MKFNLNYIPKNLRQSVGTVFVIMFFGVALLATILFAVIDYNRKLEDQISHLNNRLDQVQGGFIKSLSNSLWKIDDEQTNIILESILRQKDIELVKIVEKNKILYIMGESVEERYAINRVYPLVVTFEGENKYIGDLEIIASEKNMRALLNKEIRFSIATELIKVFFFVICTLIFIRLIITRHLDSITEFFTKNNIYISQRKLVLNRGFEFWKKSDDNFDVLVSSINAMTETLHEELQDRKKAELELKQLNESLEKRVEEKTKQLLETDRIEAVVEMSAGIAHEINSPLSVVFSLNKRLKKLIKYDNLTPENLNSMTEILTNSISRIFAITNALHMLSNVSESESEASEEQETTELVSSTMGGVTEIFKSSIGEINYVAHDLPKEIKINRNYFYQLIYMLVHIRANSMNRAENNWLRLEFVHSESDIIVTCFDSGVKIREEEKNFLLDPFKSRQQRDRGSLLMTGTFSSLVNKLNAKILFIDNNKDVYIQVRIPI